MASTTMEQNFPGKVSQCRHVCFLAAARSSERSICEMGKVKNTGEKRGKNSQKKDESTGESAEVNVNNAPVFGGFARF